MTAIEVARLKLRCTSQQRDRARFAIEHGLRTSIPDDRRLVLLRKMQVRGEAGSSDPALCHAAVRDGWLSAISGARHGSADSAADANCVWFASCEEAETLLLSRLLAGRLVDAWFWKLAVPDWRERPLSAWISDCFSEAIVRGQDRRILAMAQCFIAAGATEQLIEALSGPGGTTAQFAAAPVFFQQFPMAGTSNNLEFAVEAERTARALVVSMRSDLRQLISRLVRASEEARTMARAIVKAWLLKQSPALSLSPSVLANMLAAAIDGFISPMAPDPARSDAAQPAAPTQSGSARQSSKRQPPPRAVESPVVAQPDPPRSAAKVEANRISQDRPKTDSPISEAAQFIPHRRSSEHAGLWLVVPSLIELGFPTWLEQRPALLSENPGGQLLHEIARRYRVAADDPALAVVGEVPDARVHQEWLQLWRRGLDLWLRRKVRRRLHDLVNRPGALDCGEWSLTIHFAAADADLALRRFALDRDPGWISWLGLSVRYNFGGREDWV